MIEQISAIPVPQCATNRSKKSGGLTPDAGVMLAPVRDERRTPF
jgi:hypothetical protein